MPVSSLGDQVWHTAVVTSCLSGLDLFDPCPWMQVVDLSGSPPQGALLGQGHVL